MNWSLAIATYNRPGALRRCLELAATQSRPPGEIVVVDSSDVWEAHRDMVLRDIAAYAPSTIRWRYEKAMRRSAAAQRNQAVSLATGDVLFLIDDDSYMYPDCAEEVMKIYEADLRDQVVGVAPIKVEMPPFADMMPPIRKTEKTDDKPIIRMLKRKLYKFVERELDVQHLLLPYDREYPPHDIPLALDGTMVSRARYFSGFRMTFRASVIRQVGFDVNLDRYSAVEDLDASYRASRQGSLLNASRARIYHAQDQSARLSRYTSTLLSLLNLAYLYRYNGRDPVQLLRTYRRRLMRRLVFDLIRNSARQRLSFPSVRAGISTLLRLDKIRSIPDEQLVSWYRGVQEKIIYQDRSRKYENVEGATQKAA